MHVNYFGQHIHCLTWCIIIFTYSALIKAWSKSGDDDVPRQAKILLKVKLLSCTQIALEKGPDKIMYTSVINTYGAHGDVERAGDILEMMVRDFKSGYKDAMSHHNIQYNHQCI